jgi:hypothetical protein
MPGDVTYPALCPVSPATVTGADKNITVSRRNAITSQADLCDIQQPK